MSRIKTEKVVVTFHTTTQAIFMEECGKQENLPGRLIPVPRQISAGCGMAWCSPREESQNLSALIERNGIEVEGVYELLL